jgi:hypothetical protein
MRSMQCNVEFGYQLSICSGTKENHENPWSSWPVTGPSGCKLTSSQQSGIECTSPNIISYLWDCFITEYVYSLIYRSFNLHVIWSRNHVTTDGQSVSMSRYGARSGTCDQILFSVRMVFSESCCLVSMRRPLWREVGSVICPSQSVVIYQYLH